MELKILLWVHIVGKSLLAFLRRDAPASLAYDALRVSPHTQRISSFLFTFDLSMLRFCRRRRRQLRNQQLSCLVKIACLSKSATRSRWLLYIYTFITPRGSIYIRYRSVSFPSTELRIACTRWLSMIIDCMYANPSPFLYRNIEMDRVFASSTTSP